MLSGRELSQEGCQLSSSEGAGIWKAAHASHSPAQRICDSSRLPHSQPPATRSGAASLAELAALVPPTLEAEAGSSWLVRRLGSSPRGGRCVTGAFTRACKTPVVTVATLLITGTVGVGKSTVAAEINDILGGLGVPNAAVDLDSLVWQWPASSPWNTDLMFENLASLWPNYQAHGATHLILAGVLEDRAELDRYRAAVPGMVLSICRLLAPEAVRLDRLRERMPPGPSRDWHLRRTAELESSLERIAVEDFTVQNSGRPVREVALEVLVRAGWLPTDAAKLPCSAGPVATG